MNRKPVGKGYVFQRVRKDPKTGEIVRDKTWSFRFTVGGELIQCYGFETKREAEIAYHKAKTEEGAMFARRSSFGPLAQLVYRRMVSLPWVQARKMMLPTSFYLPGRG